MGGMHTRYPVKGHKRIALIEGSFGTNGTSDPSAASNLPVLNPSWSVAHSGTGYYTVTSLDPVKRWIRGTSHLQLDSPDGSVSTIKSYAISATTGILTVVIYTLNSAHSAADIAASANNRVNFSFAVEVEGP